MPDGTAFPAPRIPWTPAATQDPALPPTIRAIQAIVCVHFGVTLEQLRAERRDAALSDARQTGMWLARRASHTLSKIGREFRRERMTVWRAADRVDRLMRDRPDEWGERMIRLAAEAGGMNTPLVMPPRDTS